MTSGCGKQQTDAASVNQSPNQSPGEVNSNPGMELTEAENGGVVALVVNDLVSVQLDGNPATGFLWETENLDTDLLGQVGETKFTSNNNLAGGGGMFTFTFKALSAGVTHLRLIYHRPFEKNIPPARIFDVTVDIQK